MVPKQKSESKEVARGGNRETEDGSGGSGETPPPLVRSRTAAALTALFPTPSGRGAAASPASS